MYMYIHIYIYIIYILYIYTKTWNKTSMISRYIYRNATSMLIKSFFTIQYHPQRRNPQKLRNDFNEKTQSISWGRDHHTSTHTRLRNRWDMSTKIGRCWWLLGFIFGTHKSEPTGTYGPSKQLWTTENLRHFLEFGPMEIREAVFQCLYFFQKLQKHPQHL